MLVVGWVLFAIVGGLLAAWVAVAWAEWRGSRAFVLLYHRLVDDADARRLVGTEALFAVTASRFAEHLDALKRAGYRWAQPSEVSAHVEGRARMPARSVAIAFDDGCESVYRLASPLLRAHGLAATVFVTADPAAWVFHLPANPQRRLTAAELRTLVESGWDVGSHGLRHAPPSAMTTAELEEEMLQSRLWLEGEVTGAITQHAVPGNFTRADTLRLARATGHRVVWTARPGALRFASGERPQPRVNIEGLLTGSELVKSLTPPALATRRLLYELKRAPARWLGPRLWLPLRAALFRSALGRYLTSRYLRVALAIGIAITLALAVLLTLRS